MAKGPVAALLSVVVLGGWWGSGLAGERGGARPKRPARKRPEPIRAEDFSGALDQLSAIANELEGDDVAGKLAGLKTRAQEALKTLRVPERRITSVLAPDDPKAVARMIEDSAYYAVVSRLRTERRRFIEGKPELAATEKEFQDKEKQLREDHEAFYAKLRTVSPQLDKLEKRREDLEARRKQRFQRMMDRRRKGRPPKAPKAKAQ